LCSTTERTGHTTGRLLKDLYWLLKDLYWLLKDLYWLLKDLYWLLKDLYWISIAKIDMETLAHKSCAFWKKRGTTGRLREELKTEIKTEV